MLPNHEQTTFGTVSAFQKTTAQPCTDNGLEKNS